MRLGENALEATKMLQHTVGFLAVSNEVEKCVAIRRSQARFTFT